MAHTCVGNLVIIGSDNGLLPGRRQAIIWTNAGILLTGPLGTNFSEILSEIHTVSIKKIRLKTSSAKWRPFCLCLNVLNSSKGLSRSHISHLYSVSGDYTSVSFFVVYDSYLVSLSWFNYLYDMSQKTLKLINFWQTHLKKVLLSELFSFLKWKKYNKKTRTISTIISANHITIDIFFITMWTDASNWISLFILSQCHWGQQNFFWNCRNATQTAWGDLEKFHAFWYIGLILGLRPANERRHYQVTPSLSGWAQT